MKSKTIAFLTVLLLMIVLTGCNNAPPNEDKTQPFSFSESSQSTPESEAPAVNESKEVETTPETLQESEPDKQKETMEKDTVSSEQPQTDSDNRQAVQPAELPNEADKTDNPISTPQPSVPEQTESKAPEPPAVTESAEEPEASEPSAPAFNIDYWVEYAESYAQSIGLEIDSSAADCWDNPISANADSKYLERDIKSRLDRYRRDESVSQVLIWSEPDGESSYLLYIGYS